MRTLFVIAMSLSLGACGQAAAADLDPAQPAHCVAAFAYARHWVGQDTTPNGARMVREMDARGAFALRDFTAAERLAAKAEGERLITAHAGDAKAFDALFLSCGKAQDADPEFAPFASATMAKLRERGATR